jgi:hypothetical protein
VKVTQLLADAGTRVSALRIANLGSRASIEFSAPEQCALPEAFRRARLA